MARVPSVKNFERPVNKEKWVSRQPFVPQVPSNRIVSTTGNVAGTPPEAGATGTRFSTGAAGATAKMVTIASARMMAD
eukprot:scaffold316324_cov35-Tisochrysis_lutea.AAC.2